MKKKRGTIVILIIVAILILGIGYAAMTTTLVVSGTASAEVDDNNFKVVFTNATAGTPSYASSSITPTVSAKVTADNTASLSVLGFTAEGDTVTFTYTIQNQSEGLSASLGTPEVISNTNSEYFSVETAITGATTLAEDETSTMTVTVTCKKTPTDSTVSSSIEIDLVASLAD